MAATRGRDAPWLALITLTAISTVGFVDRIIMNVLAAPISQEFGLSDTQIGILTGFAFAVLNVGLGLYVARLAERRNRITLVAIGTCLWSIATAFCGAVGSWVHLLLARIGVGVGEAVGLPATQSIVADYFPPEKRASAMSVLMLAPPVGAFIGSAGGAMIAEAYGWRSAFVAAAIPGVILAVIAWLFVAEPPRGRHDAEASDEVPSLGAVIARFWSKRSLRHLVVGSTVASLVGFGLNSFVAILLIRKFEFSLVEAGLYAGLLASFPGAISVFFGGRLADHLGARNPAAYALVPGLCLLVAAPLYIFAITREDVVVLLVVMTAAALFQYTYLGVTYGTIQNMLHPRMRATGSSLLNIIYGLLGQGAGPFIVGALSDRFQGQGHGAGVALAWAMALTAAIYFWSAAHYLMAARHLRGDLAEVQAKAF